MAKFQPHRQPDFFPTHHRVGVQPPLPAFYLFLPPHLTPEATPDTFHFHT